MFNRLRSFRTKLLLLVTLASLVSAVLVGTTLVIRSFNRQRDISIQHLLTKAAIVANNSSAALQFDDRDAALETLSALAVTPTVRGAVIYDENEQEFVRFQPGDVELPDVSAGSPGQIESGRWFVVRQAVTHKDEFAGTLVIAYDLQDIRQRLQMNVLISLALGLLATGASVLVALRFHRVLARPIEELAKVAKSVSTTRDYSARALKYGEDELGQLTDVFNEMLGQIQSQALEIQTSHERFKLAQLAANVGAWDWDILSGQAQWSDEFYRLVGLDRQHVQPSYESFLGIVVPEDRERIDREVRESVQHQRELRIEFRFHHPAQGERWLAEIGRTLTDDFGRPVRLAGIAIDITERKLAEQHRQDLLESERAARAEAERASRMKDEFVATLSHELRTPLTAILGWAQILRRLESNTPEAVQGLEIIERNARVQTRIIEDLLDVSRIISGKIRLDVQQVDLAAVIEAALGTVRPAAEAKDIRLQAVLDPHVSLVRGDPNRLQQVVWNLLSNAIKFTPRGGRVQVALSRVNSHVEITVSDTGQGIHPEFLPHVFERFRQADSSTTRKHSGLGLGLAIVKQLIELHGGTVRAKSPGEGQGATFVVELPVAAAHGAITGEDRKHPRTPSAIPMEQERVSLDGLRVLVVDDEPDARELVGRILRQRNADVVLASSASEALEQVQAALPNVVVSDIGMPEQDGYELIRMIRKLPHDRGGLVPAVALTAFARSEDRTKALLAGFQMHVAKPVEPTELIATVASLAGLTGRSQSGGNGSLDQHASMKSNGHSATND